MEHRKFLKWTSAVSKRYQSKTETRGAAMLSTLKARYGDEATANMIAMAQEQGSRETKEIAGLLAGVQFSTWFHNGQSADEVFNLLRLDEARGPILEKPALHSWMGYAGTDSTKILLAKLRARYGDDGLARIVIPASIVRDTETIAKDLETALLKSWKQEEYSAGYVFQLLKIDGQDDDVLSRPEFVIWTSYLAKLDPKDPDQLMFGTLKAQYGADGVREMVDNAEKSAKAIQARINDIHNTKRKVPDNLRKVAFLSHDLENTNEFLARLRQEIWRSEGRTGDDIFKMLKLDKDLDSPYISELFDNPALGTWAFYVTKLHKVDSKNPDVISILEKRFNYGKWGLADALSTSEISAAKFLQKLQFEGWLAERFDPDTVSVMMRAHNPHNVKVQVAYRRFYKAHVSRST